MKETTYSLHSLTASLRELPGAPVEALNARIATLQRSRSALSSGVKQWYSSPRAILCLFSEGIAGAEVGAPVMIAES